VLKLKTARSNWQPKLAANVVPSSPILLTLVMEAMRSFETSVLTAATRRHIPDDGSLLLLHNLYSYNIGSVENLLL
jgi:hypothetical protein